MSMKVADVMATARQIMVEKLGLKELTFQTGCAEYGDYIEVVDPDDGTVYTVPVTVGACAHKYGSSPKMPAFSLEDAADAYQFELDEREQKAQARAEAKAKKEAEAAKAKAEREAKKAAKAAEKAKADAE